MGKLGRFQLLLNGLSNATPVSGLKCKNHTSSDTPVFQGESLQVPDDPDTRLLCHHPVLWWYQHSPELHVYITKKENTTSLWPLRDVQFSEEYGITGTKRSQGSQSTAGPVTLRTTVGFGMLSCAYTSSLDICIYN